jgi:hypothetical protein
MQEQTDGVTAPEYISIKEMADYVGVTRQAIQYAVWRTDLPEPDISMGECGKRVYKVLWVKDKVMPLLDEWRKRRAKPKKSEFRKRV